MDRLDKIICSQTTLTRTEAGRLIKIGRVTVDGKVCKRSASHKELADWAEQLKRQG